MAAKHKAEGTDSLSQAAQPEAPAAATADEAVAMLEAGLGPMEWKRTYATMTDDNGKVWYVDEESGETLESIPTGDPYTGPAT